MIETNPTGILFKKRRYSDVDKLKISIKKREQVLYQESDFDFSMLRPRNGWIESNEPEEHLDEISQDIECELKSKESRKVLCFSYKDASLACRIEGLTRKIVNTGYLISKRPNTIIYGHPEDYVDKNFEEIASTDEKVDLVICRHYLEHFHEKSKVLRGLNKYLRKDGYMYIEVPDCEEFLNRRNPLFLWEQHKIYFTSKSLKQYIKENGYEIVWQKKMGESIEPSICALIRKKNNYSSAKENKMQAKNIEGIDNTANIEKMISEYKSKWTNRLCQKRKSVVIYGVGHNTDRFLQYTNIYKYIDHIVDGNPEKQGLYILNYDKQIESDKILHEIEAPVIICGCHDRVFGSIAKKLKQINNEAEVLNIFGDI